MSRCMRPTRLLPLALRNSKNMIFTRNAHSRTFSKRKSLYDVLDVSHTATQDEIKAAYYELSLKYHPDMNKSDEAQHKFQELTNAYNVLRNLTSRRDYDKEIGTYFTMRSTKVKQTEKKVLRLTDEMLEIDMKGIRQSRIFLGTIATLSTIMGTPVRLMNVSVSDGGIQSHDMRVLQLLRQICGGTLAASTGLSMVTFVPGDLLPGNFSAEAGRLGDLSHLVASSLPCFPFAPVPEYTKFNRLYLKGATHPYRRSLHADYIQSVVMPFVGKFGFDFQFDIRKRSYHPYWEGKICVESLPVHNLSSVEITDSGTVNKITGWAFVSGAKPIRIAQIMAKEVHQILKHHFPQVPVDINSQRNRESRSEGTGQGLMLLAEMSSGVVLTGTGMWEKGMSPEEVVNQAVRMLIKNVNSEACIDSLLQEQAIVLMSLASGKSSLKMPRLTNQAKAAMLAVETFTKVKFNVSSKTAKNVLVECEGLGLVNEEVLPEDNYESDDEDKSGDEHESRDKRVSDDEHESDHEYELDEKHERM